MVYFEDKYAIRYIDIFEYRCEAFKFYWGTATYSDKVAFWYKDYATPQDAIKAARKWVLRGELEREPDEVIFYALANGLYSEPSPELVKARW